MHRCRYGHRRVWQPTASSMSSLARGGSSSAHSMLLDCRNANLALSRSVNWPLRTSASTAAASSPRPNHDNACARTNFGSGPAPASDCGFRQLIREGQVAQPDRAVRCPDEQVGVGCQVGIETQSRAAHDDSQVVTVVWMRRVRQRPVHGAVVACCVVRAYGATPHRADAPTAPRYLHRQVSSAMSPRVSASSIAAASVIRVRGASSIGSPTASASITSLTGVGSAPIRDSIRSTRPGGMIGSPIHRQYPFRCTSSTARNLLLDDVPQIQSITASQLPQPVSGVRIHRTRQCRRKQGAGFLSRQLL